MARVLKLLVALAVVIAAMVFLSGVDSQKPLKRIEQPVNVDAPAE